MKPTYYNKTPLERLRNEAKDRFNRLMTALEGRAVVYHGQSCIDLDGPKVRLAVDDFGTILKELRKLK